MAAQKKNTRIETDTFGPIDVPADRYWGAQTERRTPTMRVTAAPQKFPGLAGPDRVTVRRATEKFPVAALKESIICMPSDAAVNAGLASMGTLSARCTPR